MEDLRSKVNLPRVSTVAYSDIRAFVEGIFELVCKKGSVLSNSCSELPSDGIYMFFETGQKISIGSTEFDRIVRIGINEKPRNFRRRIRSHYKGNIKESVFRENVGWALLESEGKSPYEVYRTKKQFKNVNSGGALEREISSYFSVALTFKSFKIAFDKLASYERVLLNAFSIYYQSRIENKDLDLNNWLGKYSYSQQNRIRRSGLWNCEGVLLHNGSNLFERERNVAMRNPIIEFDSLIRDLAQNIIYA